MSRFLETINKFEAISLLAKIAEDSVCSLPHILNRSIMFYGAGNLGRMAKEYFESLGVTIEIIVDYNAKSIQKNSYWDDVTLLSPDEVTVKQRQEMLLAVTIVNVPYVPLATKLRNAGWLNVVPFYDITEGFRHCHPLSNGWVAPPFLSTDIENIQKVLEHWGDDISRAHHLQFIAWRRLRQEWSFSDAPITIENRFFIPEVVSLLTDDEVFVDVGAHFGSVTESFIKRVNARFKHIWAIEPDADNRMNLLATIDTYSVDIKKRISVLPIALADKSCTKKFQAGLGYASQFFDFGVEVECLTLDSLDISPTFIKLHVEGAELIVLQGAIKTIKRCRPIIAVTTYHNADGLWVLPKWLYENLDNYVLVMRLHSWCGTGSVVYAIPRERQYCKD